MAAKKDRSSVGETVDQQKVYWKVGKLAREMAAKKAYLTGFASVVRMVRKKADYLVSKWVVWMVVLTVVETDAD